LSAIWAVPAVGAGVFWPAKGTVSGPKIDWVPESSGVGRAWAITAG
jgi:hypothetical protein